MSEDDGGDGAAGDAMNASAGTGGGTIDAAAGTIDVGADEADGAETGGAAGDGLACPLALLADGAGVGVGGGADAVV